MFIFIYSFYLTMIRLNANTYVAHLFLTVFFASFLLFSISFCEKPFIKKNRVYRVFDYLGIYTYGLYVYSGFFITFVNQLVQLYNVKLNPILLFMFEFLLLFAIAFASYNLYEVKFLNYSKKFRWRNYTRKLIPET